MKSPTHFLSGLSGYVRSHFSSLSLDLLIAEEFYPSERHWHIYIYREKEITNHFCCCNMSSENIDGITDEIELNVNDQIQNSDYAITFNINETVQAFVDYFSSKYPNLSIGIDIGGSNVALMSDKSKKTLASIGVTNGTTVDITNNTAVHGGMIR